jgi:TPR repeat protein
LDADAYLHLGRCCERGLGTTLDVSKALDWYHLSIDKTDSSEAMFRVGQIYAVKDVMQSVFWYRRAISKDDHPRANFRLAFHYVHGVYQEHRCVLEPDLSAAVHHFRTAAKQNDLDAMYELGQLLLTTTKDEMFALFLTELQLEGISWYEIAADRGSVDAQRELGNLYHRGRESFDDQEEEEEEERNYHIYAVQQDFERAYDYFSFAAHLGDKTSALFLGTYYEHGICVPPNIELAQSWYTVAVELGKSLPLHDLSGWWPAQLCLARVLHQNEETQKEAYALFATVYSHKPEQHMAYLEMMLAQYELYGLGGVPVQAERAVAKLLNLAEEGYLKAFFPIAQCFEKGIGVKKDLSKALQWYVLLVHNPVVDQDTLDEDDLEDVSHAYFCLAEFYRQGIVVAVDLEKSDTLYRIAAERGK